MTFWFRGHHYRSQVRHMLVSLRHWYNIKGAVRAVWRGEKYFTWFGHEDDCCDYWTPIQMSDGTINPKVKEVFMLDDVLSLDIPKDKKL